MANKRGSKSSENPKTPTAEERLDKWMITSIGTFHLIQSERQQLCKNTTINLRDKLSRFVQLTDNLWEIADTCARTVEKDRRGKYSPDKLKKLATDLMAEKLQFQRYLDRMTAGVDPDFQALLDKPHLIGGLKV